MYQKARAPSPSCSPEASLSGNPLMFSHFPILKELSNYLASLEGDTRIVMECTGRYHESMANPL